MLFLKSEARATKPSHLLLISKDTIFFLNAENSIVFLCLNR